ncbi:hypothetical protein O6H91_04G060600 [Diphasiastrum complanatum]|uniref:Uncharacterized protein n=1 Tax=Diphasiastrum complanatum TaxID=34168 RepID=A0ACC2DY08_DIPCM|nr:hypothetical protein O6H91_04G060600 [Diphasiastrum complanatum]
MHSSSNWRKRSTKNPNYHHTKQTQAQTGKLKLGAKKHSQSIFPSYRTNSSSKWCQRHTQNPDFDQTKPTQAQSGGKEAPRIQILNIPNRSKFNKVPHRSCTHCAGPTKSRLLRLFSSAFA